MDNNLYTGVKSPEAANFDQAEEIQKEQRELTDIIPNAEAILELLASEREAIADIRSYIGQGFTARFKIMGLWREYRARELYMGFLNRFEELIVSRLDTEQQERTR